jgi:hypothetical protein
MLTNDGLAAYYYRASAVVQVLITLRENIVTAEADYSLSQWKLFINYYSVGVRVYHLIIERTPERRLYITQSIVCRRQKRESAMSVVAMAFLSNAFPLDSIRRTQ